MTMVAVSHRGGLEGAAGATGPTVVIDTFRAFSTAAYLIAAGAGPILLAETIDEARAAAARIDAAILCGEDRGRQPPDFDLGNSPGEVIEARYLEGRPVVQRTSAGTRCARAAMRSGAKPLYAARSLAGAASVSIIASGRLGTIPVEEDDATAHLIGALITGTPIDAPNLVGKIRRGPSAERLRRADWAHDDDLDLCLDVDRFDFSMRVVAAGRDVILEPEAAQ
jgi:2-phosphosulfolactate phosphatase